MSKIFESRKQFYYDNITKLITDIAVALLIILIFFILLKSKIYQYYKIIKKISKENMHINLDPSQSYDNS